MERLFTTHDISDLVNVDPSTVSKWIDRGLLTAFRTPGGHRRVRSTDLRRFLVCHEMPVPDVLGTEVTRLLLADADAKGLESLKQSLKAHPVELTATHSGVEALLMLSQLKPHGVVLDLALPDVDVLEAIRQVMARPEGIRVAVLVNSANDSQSEEARRAGASGCIARPARPAAVLSALALPERVFSGLRHS